MRRAVGKYHLEDELTEIQEVCSRAEVDVPLSRVDVVDFALGRVTVLAAGDVFSKDALRRFAEVPELQMRCGRLVPQLSSVTLQCKPWRSLIGELGTKNIDLCTLLATWNDTLKLLEV